MVVVVVVEKHLKTMHTPLQSVTIRRERIKKTHLHTLVLVQEEQLDRLTATIDLEVSHDIQSP